MRFPVTLVAGPALGVLLFVGAFEPLAARADTVVFEDHELGDWQFLVPPGDPEIELEHSAPGGGFLAVRQHHTAQFSSLKRSIQGSSLALYAPGSSGAVESIQFAARFRAHYEGVGPAAAYQTRIVEVRAVALQGGQSFVASRSLFVWADSDATLDQWVAVDSGPLVESEFRLEGPQEIHPDFSTAGAPMTLALRVSSFYRTSYEEIYPDNTFTVDIDDVTVRAQAPTAGDLPRLSFSTAGGLAQMSCGPVAMASGNYEGSSATSDLYVRLSEAGSSGVSFHLRRDGADFVPPRGGAGIAAGGSSARISVDLPAGQRAQVYELAASTGATIGEPRRLALLSRSLDDCAFVVQAHWRSDLRAQGCDPVGSESKLARNAADVPAGILELPGVTELQAVRDQVMAVTPAGRYYAELYRTLSPMILRTLLAHPTLLLDLFLSQDAWVAALATLTEGDADAAHVSAGMEADLNRLLDAFESEGSSALARTIDRERARLGLSSISGLTMNQFWQRVNDRWEPEPCVADDNGLCLGDSRYRVEADWKTPAGGSGRAHAVALSGDSGYFWFFDSANVEILTKIVDGCGANQRTWSYSAGLTNLEVELFVLDTATGRGKSYRNPQATSFAPVLDSDYLECLSTPVAAESSGSTAPSPAAAGSLQPLGAGSCVPGSQTLCLDGGRFRVEADWRTAAGASGAARAVPLTDDTGTFWFFNPANIELVVKTIDACGLAGFENYWVFAGGTTDVEVELRVTDTLRNVSKTYRRPLGVPFAPILDSGAFATCP